MIFFPQQRVGLLTSLTTQRPPTKTRSVALWLPFCPCHPDPKTKASYRIFCKTPPAHLRCLSMTRLLTERQQSTPLPRARRTLPPPTHHRGPPLARRWGPHPPPPGPSLDSGTTLNGLCWQFRLCPSVHNWRRLCPLSIGETEEDFVHIRRPKLWRHQMMTQALKEQFRTDYKIAEYKTKISVL
jgi:hypothetical protein